MNSSQIENNLEALIKNIATDEFIFDLLLAYGIPKATVTLLKKGRHNLSKKDGRVILKKKLFFQEVIDADLHVTIDNLQKEKLTMQHDPRFIIVTDYKDLLAVDTKTSDQLDIEIRNIPKHYDFFLPWAGIEKHRHSNENPADRKAAEKMAKLYDGILAENNISTKEKTHALNVFLSRLLFCFFAEDTNIFEEKIFTNSLASHTQSDGSDLDSYLGNIFDALNVQDKTSYPQYIQKFPYVNGGLFSQKFWVPKFSSKSRKIIIECGELDWAEINPDIFGSMMQAVTHPGQRASLGMHYTSVSNIMKVIEPLFLGEIKDEFEKYRDNGKKLESLLSRITKIKLFDPACGSGNFLIIGYKELRRIEMKIIRELNMLSLSGVKLSNFYGIEIDDFAHEISKLSLYLAEHQMNIEFLKETGKINPTLPLKIGGNIFCDNAVRVDWEKICPKNKGDEIYVLGNPPYQGARKQDEKQKNDMAICFSSDIKFSNLDYISCWFYKGKQYITNMDAKLGFVTTNSVCQGVQVALLWPRILDNKIEIDFAYTSFQWKNNAKANAGVSVLIIGLRNISKKHKFIFNDKNKIIANNISPYITDNRNIYISERNSSISNLPHMCYGSMPNDGGNLILSAEERRLLVSEFPSVSSIIKGFVGADEFMNGKPKFCLWITNDTRELAGKVPFIADKIKKTRQYRLISKRKATKKLAQSPEAFGEIRYKPTNSILVPQTGSERRAYIPAGFFDSETVISNAARVIYDAEPWVFGLISSRMHIVWVRAVAGRMKNDMQYSNSLCYNTFPITSLSTKQKDEITTHVYSVLEERERHSEKTMSQLYDPDKMPIGLKEAHQSLDLAVERCYRSKPFVNDEERLETLFKLYEQMIANEKVKNNSNKLI